MATNEEIQSMWNNGDPTLAIESILERIEALERKAEHTARRFMEVEDTPVYQASCINELREKHNALCDVVSEVVGYLRINHEPMDRLIENAQYARIDTAQDEAQTSAPNVGNNNAEHIGVDADNIGDGDTDDGGDCEGEVDAIIEELRKDYSVIVNDARSSAYSDMTNESWVTHLILSVRPIIEKLVRERDEQKSLDEDSCKRIAIVTNQRDKERQRADRLEAMVDRMAGELVDVKAENKKLKAEVARLRSSIENIQEQAQNRNTNFASVVSDLCLKALAT